MKSGLNIFSGWILAATLALIQPALTSLTPRNLKTVPTSLVRRMDQLTPTLTPVTLFARENNTEVMAQIGTTVVFHCAAHNVGENTVSWIRKRDYHLLTVGTTTYSSDQRFQVRYIDDDKDWQLHIRYVQKHDAGGYECQVSSHPPISLMTRLNVVEATSEILGGPEKYLRAGSSLRLVCILRQNTQPPSYVFWYLNHQMINYNENVKVDTSKELSVLFLTNLGPESSGNYTCVPSNAKPSTIHIQVLRGGEMPAAIHSSSPSTRNFLRFEAFVLSLILSTTLCSSTSHFFFLYIATVETLPYVSTILQCLGYFHLAFLELFFLFALFYGHFVVVAKCIRHFKEVNMSVL